MIRLSLGFRNDLNSFRFSFLYTPSTNFETVTIFLSERDQVLSDRGIPTPEVYIMNADGSNQLRLTNNKDFERTLSWSPKGNVVAVSINVLASGIYFPEEIYLMNLNGVVMGVRKVC